MRSKLIYFHGDFLSDALSPSQNHHFIVLDGVQKWVKPNPTARDDPLKTMIACDPPWFWQRRIEGIGRTQQQGVTEGVFWANLPRIYLDP